MNHLPARPIDPALVQIVADLAYNDRFGRVWHPGRATTKGGYWIATDRVGYADDEPRFNAGGPVANYFWSARDADEWCIDRLHRQDPPTTLAAPHG